MSDMVTASIESVMEPVQVPLQQAVTLLWENLRKLPLGDTQYQAYQHFLGPGVFERIDAAFAQDRVLQLTFSMNNRLHTVRVEPAIDLAAGEQTGRRDVECAR